MPHRCFGAPGDTIVFVRNCHILAQKFSWGHFEIKCHDWQSDSEASGSAEENAIVCLFFRFFVCLSVYRYSRTRCEIQACALIPNILSWKARLLLTFRPLAQCLRLVVMKP